MKTYTWLTVLWAQIHGLTGVLSSGFYEDAGKSTMTELEVNDNRILSRQRRFFFPDFNSTWTFVTTFTIKFPLTGWDAGFEGSVPIVTTFDANE